MSNRTGSSSSSNPYENYSLSEMLAELREIREEAARMNSGSRENTTKEMLETVFSELEMMREEMELEQGNQKEAQRTSNETLGTVLIELRMMREEMERMRIEQENHKEVLANFQRRVATENCQPDIKKQIFGKWRDANDETHYFSAKFEDDHFFMKWNGWRSFNEYALAMKHQNGVMATVETNKLVQRRFSGNGEEARRDEFHFENERIIQVRYEPGEASITWTYERIGDPDSE